MPPKPSRFQWVYLVRRAVAQSCVTGLLVWTVSTAQVQTDITPDGTMGTEVTHTGTIHDITGGTRPGNGQNLFHSFDRFSVGTGDTARFLSDPGIDNIISRVTGGAESMIDGTLQAEANLFLLNPQGIMFGPNATLNINGSFHASTADELRFADGATFSARLNERMTMTVAAPSAFGFLSENPAGIILADSQLEVPDGESLSIVGGGIRIVGDGDPWSGAPTISAPGGWVSLVSVASSGEVGFDPTRQVPEFDVGSFDRLGEIEVMQGAQIDASGEGGGTVSIRGGKLVVDNSSLQTNTLGDVDGANVGIDVQITEDAVFTNDSLLTADVQGAGNSGNIQITGQRVEVSNDALIRSQTSAGGSGNSGQITFTAGYLQVKKDGSIESRLLRGSSGDAGNIVIKVDRISLDNGYLFSLTEGSGDAADIEVRADQLTLTDGEVIASGTSGENSGNSGLIIIEAGSMDVDNARITTATLNNSSGHAGTIRITATDSIIITGQPTTGRSSLLSSFSQSNGNAGDIEIRAQQLILTDGAQIASFTESGSSGDGGVIRIDATDNVTISGRPSDVLRSGLFSFTESIGDAGGIKVRAGRLILADGAVIDGSARTGSSGDAGSVTIEVDSLELNGTQIISVARQGSRGRAGTVRITATDSVIVTGVTSTGAPSGLFSNTESSGEAGVVEVQTRRLVLSDGGQIASIAFRGSSGQGGTVRVSATDSMTITGSGGQESISGRVFASGLLTSTAGSGDAGTIQVSAGQLIIIKGGQITSSTAQGSSGQGGTVHITAMHGITIVGSQSAVQSSIAAQAEGNGSGGNIIIQAPTIELSDGALISAESIRGNAGNILITASTLSLQNDSSITARSARHSGGNIEVQSQTVRMVDSEITTTVLGGEGSGGNILIGRTINANGDIIEGLESFTLEGSRMAANTDAGDGANIVIGARQVVLDSNSDVTANTHTGVGGNVTIAGTIAANGQALTRAEVIVLRDSRITAKADEGKGGRIDIVAEAVLADPDSEIDASSQAGIDGEVNIEAVRTNLSEIVTPLSPRFAQTAALLSDPCASRLQRGIVSSLVARGPASVPATPDGLLPSRLYSRAIDPAEPERAGPREALALNSHVRLSRPPCP